MTTKRYAKIKTFISENSKFIFFLFCSILLFLIPLPYVIDMPGGLISTEGRVLVSQGQTSSGSFNLSYVSEKNANISLYLLSFMRKDWKRVKISETKYDHETLKESMNRSKLLLKQANQNALMVAYSKAKKKITKKHPQFYLAYIDQKVLSTTPLKVGDCIQEINGEKITSYEQILDKIQTTSVGDTLLLKVKRNQKTFSTNITVLKLENEKRLGLLLIPIYEMITEPSVKFIYHSEESGSSGGLMIALEIYNQLTTQDITHGKTIVGTGSIDEKGNVGEIAGIEFKLRGAVKKKADIFFVPSGKNYKEAIKLKKKERWKIQIVEVKTFDDAIHFLENLS